MHLYNLFTQQMYGTALAAGDSVGVLLDMDRGTIRFFKEGDDFLLCKMVLRDMGIAYRYVKPLHYTLYTPFIAVYAPMYTRCTCIYAPYIHLTHL